MSRVIDLFQTVATSQMIMASRSHSPSNVVEFMEGCGVNPFMV